MWQEFLQKFNGAQNVGNTVENKSECTGLVNVFIVDWLKKSFIWGNAKDFFTNYNPSDFDLILNTPEAIPQQGDIVIWGQAYNGNYGHVGIATGTGDLNTFEAFEQNDPLGSNCHLKTYKYTSVLGWLKVKEDDALTQCLLQHTELVSKLNAIDGFRKALNQSLNTGDKDWQGILDEVNKLINELDNTQIQAKVGDSLWDAIVKQTGLQVVKYTDEGVSSLVTGLETLKKTVPNGYRLMTEVEYIQLTSKKPLEAFTGWELIKEGIKKLLGKGGV